MLSVVIQKDSEAEIRDVVWEIVRNEREYLPTIFDYWFTNNYRQFFVEELAADSVVVRDIHRKVKQSNQPTRAEINAAKNELRPILMDCRLSTGKELRLSTFGECASESGWLREVAKQGKPNGIVGKKLTEKDLWNLRKRTFPNQ